MIRNEKILRLYERFYVLLLLTPIIFLPKVTLADDTTADVAPVAKVNGELRNETAYRVSEPQEFAKIKNLFFIEGKYELMPNIKFTLSGRGYYDAVYGIQNNYPDNVKRDQETELVLRNAYVDVSYNNLDARIGKQQIVWGEAATFVADIVNPKDLREFLLPDFEYIRIPIWAVDIYYWMHQGLSAEIVWSPDLTFNKLPVKGSEFKLYDPLEHQGLRVVNTPAQKPPVTFNNSIGGVKVNSSANGSDFSLFYLYAYDDFPTKRHKVLIDTITGEPYLLEFPEYNRLHNLGMTFATTAGATIIKGELVILFSKYFLSTDVNAQDGVTQRTSANYMLGFNYNFPFDINLDFQVIQEIIEGPSNTLNEDLVKTYASARISKRYLMDKLYAEMFFILGVKHGDYQFSPKISYRVTDDTSISLGADMFGGPVNTLYGQFHRKDRLAVTLSYKF